LQGDAVQIKQTPFGAVGTLFSGASIEAVWVSKHQEAIDPDWFSQPTVDLILVVQGQLHVEFADPATPSVTLQPGDMLILPPQTACRAYRWPRDAAEPTIFLAVYPRPDAGL
jgi:hypothetical protein